jgi:hypothetical protein
MRLCGEMRQIKYFTMQTEHHDLLENTAIMAIIWECRDSSRGARSTLRARNQGPKKIQYRIEDTQCKPSGGKVRTNLEKLN